MEKQYIEYLNEITSEALCEGLVGYGLFAEKIPPFLTSVPFYEYCKENNLQPDNNGHEYIYYENMRNINVPRAIGIPNPFACFRLCRYTAEHWKKIRSHFKDKTINNKYKVSRIHLRRIYDKNRKRLEKKLFSMNYGAAKESNSPSVNLLPGKQLKELLNGV